MLIGGYMDFFSTSQKRIIELLLTADKTLPELATALGRSKPGTSKYLKELEEIHIVKGAYERNVDGRTIRYHLQPFHMVLSIDPQSKTAFSFAADDALDTEFLSLGFIPQKELREEMKDYLKEIQKTDIQRLTVVLYGSVAQGIANRKSDIDLLLVKERWMKNEQNSILRSLADASEKTTHPAKPLFLSYSEFEQMDPVLKKEIKDHGVILFEKGSPWETIRPELRRYTTITS
jgi:predicted nucleotidyltransferase